MTCCNCLSSDTEPELFDVSHLPEKTLEAIEADSFWCLNKLLDGIQDNYVSGQPGIRVKVDRLKELCERVDAPLAAHLKDNHIEFMQFAFKWIHLLLLRVLPIDAVVRMWDTYMVSSSRWFAAVCRVDISIVRGVERLCRLPHLCLLSFPAAIQLGSAQDGFPSYDALFSVARRARCVVSSRHGGVAVRGFPVEIHIWCEPLNGYTVKVELHLKVAHHSMRVERRRCDFLLYLMSWYVAKDCVNPCRTLSYKLKKLSAPPSAS